MFLRKQQYCSSISFFVNKKFLEIPLNMKCIRISLGRVFFQTNYMAFAPLDQFPMKERVLQKESISYKNGKARAVALVISQ